MKTTTFLVFGDLHGRILPAFRLAMAWARDHGLAVTGILQVGDLGYFPDPQRLDKATLRHAQNDPLELGTTLVTEPNTLADETFYGEQEPPAGLWFTAGNHEDFDALRNREKEAERNSNSFVVDYYGRAHCIRDGNVAILPGSLRVGALWGIDGVAPGARRNYHMEARIREKSVLHLICSSFDVLLTHDSPRDAVLVGSGSEEIGDVIRSTKPAFAFFGHYGGKARQIEGDFGATEVYHLNGFSLREKGGCAEEGSVGVLTWEGKKGNFRYLEADWLKTFTRHNWKHW